MLYFYECEYLLLVLTNARQSDRGGLEGQNVAINPCPPTKDYPPLHLADRLFSVKNRSQQRQRAVQNCSLFVLKG